MSKKGKFHTFAFDADFDAHISASIANATCSCNPPFDAAHRHEKVTRFQDHGLLVERPSDFLPRTEISETLSKGSNSVQRDPSRGALAVSLVMR